MPPSNPASSPLIDVAKLFKALSDENRLRIILNLLQRRDVQVSVSELVEHLGLSQPLVSHHLRELKFAGLVEGERKGAFVYYVLKSHEVIRLMEYGLKITDHNYHGRELHGISGLLTQERRDQNGEKESTVRISMERG